MKISKHIFLSSLVLCISFFSLLASDPVVKISPKPVWVINKTYNNSYRPHDSEIGEGSFISCLETQVNVVKQQEYTHEVIDLINESGVQNNSQLTIRFDPSFQNITFHRLQIIRNGKVMDILDVSKFKIIREETELSRFIYNGTYSALFIAEDIRVGDKLEFDYTLSGFNPVFKGKYFCSYFFQGSQPVGFLYFSVIMPPGRKLFVKKINDAPDVITSKTGEQNSMKYEWTQLNKNAYFSEDWEPDWYSRYPYIQVGEMNSWKEVVDWTLSISPSLMNLTPDTKELISRWKKESTGDTDYALRCVHFVQDQIRYMGIETNIYTHKPHDPSQIVKQRYGDCKDKSLLLCALLTTNEIECYPVLINTSKRAHTNELLPSPLSFDHCVVLIKIDGREYWIDPTVSLQRGTLSQIYFPHYGKGLVVKRGENALKEITDSQGGKTKVIEKFAFGEIESDGFLKVETEYSGVDADEIRNQFQDASLESLQKSYLDYYAKIYDSILVESPLSFTDNEADNKISVVESYRIKHPWSPTKSDSLQYFFQLQAQLLKSHLVVLPKKDRIGPVRIKYPFTLDYTIDVETPESWSIKTEDINVNDKAFEFSYSSGKKVKGFTLSYSYRALIPELNVADIRNYNKNVDEVLEQCVYNITWNKNLSEANLSSGSRLNVSFMLIAVMVLTGFTFLALRIYKSGVKTAMNLRKDQIGGWMILALIGLLIRPFKLIYQFFTINFFNDQYITQLKINSSTADVHWDAIFIFEICANILMFVLCILCIVSFLKRRDITPRLMIANYLISFVLIGLDHIIALNLNLGEELDSKDVYRTFAACIIWVPFFIYSEKVKNTFTVPYNENNRDESVTDESNMVTGQPLAEIAAPGSFLYENRGVEESKTD